MTDYCHNPRKATYSGTKRLIVFKQQVEHLVHKRCTIYCVCKVYGISYYSSCVRVCVRVCVCVCMCTLLSTSCVSPELRGIQHLLSYFDRMKFSLISRGQLTGIRSPWKCFSQNMLALSLPMATINYSSTHGKYTCIFNQLFNMHEVNKNVFRMRCSN